MLLGLALALLAQAPCGPGGPIYCSGIPRAFFEFAPQDGAGMGASCACTTPTGAKGETLTFTRGSSGTCLKGSTSSGIANGDMVTCTTDQARVMPGGAGTGANGIFVEGARTNAVLRSQEISNAAWGSSASGCVATTVTADAAVAPDGTTTAERLQVPACSAAQYSWREQSVSSATRSGSVFVKGNGSSGNATLAVWNGSAAVCVSCPYVAASWSRCLNENVATAQQIWIGTAPLYCGGVGTSALDFFVWGAQVETGAFASSYIATTSAAVTRATDVPTFSVTVPTGGFASAAVTFAPGVGFPDGVAYLQARIDGSNLYTIQSVSVAARSNFLIGGSNALTTAPGTLAGLSANAMAMYYDATNRASCLAGACTTTASSLTLPTGSATLYVGTSASGAGNEAGGVIKRLCLDTSSARCR